MKRLTFNRRMVCATLGALPLIVVGVAGCDQQQLRDLEDVTQQAPDKAELYVNVDQYPNIVRICIDGVAFATMTRDYEPILRVPEWDASFCGAAR